MSALAGALGSVIGYLGSEVAERALFERLLWPQRFYNDFNFSIFLKLMFLMPMGGPLHAAALKTLDNFREHGLYLGRCRGNMLGTAFFPDSQVKNYLRTQEEERGLAKASRNALWLEVLRNVNETDEKPHLPQNDAESKNGEIPPYRAMQLVRHLTLGLVPDTQSIESGIVSIKEDSVTWRALVGIFSSELSTLAAAFTAGKPLKCWWLIPYFCTPLFLKLLAVLVSVRRAPLQSVDELEKQSSLSPTEIFEIDDLNHGFAVIEGPAPVVQQFFRHYSHPIRHSQSIGLGDRSRELFSIALIYAFVLYFPVGLVCLLWMRLKVQYLWLGYQVYAIIVMHVIRILGWGGCGRTEERIAGHLKRGKTVWLQTQTGCTVSAKLAVTSVPNVATGRKAVQAIIERHHQQRNNDSDSSGSPCSSQVASASGDSRKRSEQQLVPHFVGNRPVELGANFTSPSNERDVRPAPGSPSSGPTSRFGHVHTTPRRLYPNGDLALGRLKATELICQQARLLWIALAGDDHCHFRAVLIIETAIIYSSKFKFTVARMTRLPNKHFVSVLNVDCKVTFPLGTLPCRLESIIVQSSFLPSHSHTQSRS